MIHIVKHSKFDKPMRVYVCGEDLVYIKDLIDKHYRVGPKKTEPIRESINWLFHEALRLLCKKHNIGPKWQGTKVLKPNSNRKK